MIRRKFSRRDFLVTGAAAVAVPYVIPSSVLGLDGSTPPSETVRVGMAGLGGRARWILLNEYLPGAKSAASWDTSCSGIRRPSSSSATKKPIN